MRRASTPPGPMPKRSRSPSSVASRGSTLRSIGSAAASLSAAKGMSSAPSRSRCRPGISTTSRSTSGRETRSSSASACHSMPPGRVASPPARRNCGRVRVAEKGQPPRSGAAWSTCQPWARRPAAQVAKPSCNWLPIQRQSSAWPAASRASSSAVPSNARTPRRRRGARPEGAGGLADISPGDIRRSTAGCEFTPPAPDLHRGAPCRPPCRSIPMAICMSSAMARSSGGRASPMPGTHPALLRGFHRRFCLQSRLLPRHRGGAGAGARARPRRRLPGPRLPGPCGGCRRRCSTTWMRGRTWATRWSIPGGCCRCGCSTAGGRRWPSPMSPTGRMAATAGRARTWRRRRSRGGDRHRRGQPGLPAEHAGASRGAGGAGCRAGPDRRPAAARNFPVNVSG